MAEVVFVFKAIKPKRLKIDAIRLELLNELRREGKDQRNELDKTTETWKGDKPKFQSEIGLGASDASVATGPGGPTQGVKKWNWLNEGTRVRHALMSPNWRSKTVPRKVKSRRGRGRLVTVSKKIVRPGIKAREWSGIVQERRKKPFRRRLLKAMQRAGKGAF